MMGLGEESGIHLTGEQAGESAGTGVDGDSLSARTLDLGAHRECFDRSGLRRWFTSANGDGVRSRRQWRHLLLSAVWSIRF